MIIKSFEISKKKFDKQNIFLVYGENEGLKNEIVEILKKKLSGILEKFDETQIINNKELFYEKLLNQSLFEKEKIIVINRCSEKIYEIIESITERVSLDTKIILNAYSLEKKSKLRNLFEKSSKTLLLV